ncbi:MAG: enoyl-CoA hydratase-related protein, partial [Microvirga sp.]
PEMTLGAYPGAGGAIVLPRLVGPARAKEIFFTARRIRGDDALALGIVERIVPREELISGLTLASRRRSPLTSVCGGRSKPRKTTKKAFRHTSRNGPPYFVVNRPRSCRPHKPGRGEGF